MYRVRTGGLVYRVLQRRQYTDCRRGDLMYRVSQRRLGTRVTG